MKKIQSLIVIVVVSITFSGNVFSQAFDDGTNLIFLGFGIPPSERIKNEFTDYKNFSDYTYHNYGTGVLKYEHGLHKYFGIGLNVEYSGASASYKYGDNNNLPYEKTKKLNAFGFYGRINGHLPIGEKLDLFAGVGLGYFYSIYKINDTNPVSSINEKKKESVLDFDYQFTAGLRFMVKDNIGLFVEAGWATTPVQLGLVFKF